MLPLGAKAAGQLVTLADPVTDGKARVVAPGAHRVAGYNDPVPTPYIESGRRNVPDHGSEARSQAAAIPRARYAAVSAFSVHG